MENRIFIPETLTLNGRACGPLSKLPRPRGWGCSLRQLQATDEVSAKYSTSYSDLYVYMYRCTSVYLCICIYVITACPYMYMRLYVYMHVNMYEPSRPAILRASGWLNTEHDNEKQGSGQQAHRHWVSATSVALPPLLFTRDRRPKTFNALNHQKCC